MWIALPHDEDRYTLVFKGIDKIGILIVEKYCGNHEKRDIFSATLN